MGLKTDIFSSSWCHFHPQDGCGPTAAPQPEAAESRNCLKLSTQNHCHHHLSELQVEVEGVRHDDVAGVAVSLRVSHHDPASSLTAGRRVQNLTHTHYCQWQAAGASLRLSQAQAESGRLRSQVDSEICTFIQKKRGHFKFQVLQ